jgi:putative ABC transport system substrate-binding protein
MGATSQSSIAGPRGATSGAEIAAEFARLKVNVIVTTGSSALAVKEAIATVPVVFALWADPVGSGYIAGLNRPSGNATGLSI